MNSDEYQKKALRTEVTPLFVNDREGKPSLLLSRVMHAAMGMVTEAAEVIDMLKKHFIYGKPFDPINLLEEVGDEQWYCALMLAATGFDFKQTFERNIAKLLKRFPDKFTEGAALNRDLAAERASLEEALPSDKEICDLAFRVYVSYDEDHSPEVKTDHARKLHAALGKVL